MRGRLIFKFQAELHRVDTRATAIEPPDVCDRLFKLRVVSREHTPVRIPCQVEPKVFEQLHMMGSGNAPQSEIKLVFHFKDLERLGLVDITSGQSLIHASDRLGAIYDRTGELVMQVETPPGLYVEEAVPIGFGLGLLRPRRNLLLVTFKERTQAARRSR